MTLQADLGALTCSVAAILCLSSGLAQAQQQPAGSFQLVRSLSGPSGKVVKNRFVFDETRSRFEYPKDKRFVVYFEWTGPAGDHTLTGIWRGPDGRALQISPDVRLKSSERDIGAYWNYVIQPETPSGTWTLEVRINGQPAGEHPFVLAVPGTMKAPGSK